MISIDLFKNNRNCWVSMKNSNRSEEDVMNPVLNYFLDYHAQDLEFVVEKRYDKFLKQKHSIHSFDARKISTG